MGVTLWQLILSQQCEIIIMNSYIIPYILIYFDERVAGLLKQAESRMKR
jgi:hypothetical protein